MRKILLLDKEGFTLIEAMIASLVGLIVTLGAMQVNQYIARNSAIQNGNSSFVSLMSDVSLRLSDTRNLALAGNQASVCLRTLGSGTPNPQLQMPGPTPGSMPIILWDANNNAVGGTPFLQTKAANDNSQVYGNLFVKSVTFIPVGQPAQNAAGSNYSLPGEIQITAIRTADLNIAPRPTPTLTGTIPLNVIYSSTAPYYLQDCGRLSSNASQPVTPPTCPPASPSSPTGYYLTQDPTTGVWKCNPVT